MIFPQLILFKHIRIHNRFYISVQELDTVTFGEGNKKIGEVNPFRYRGYYYDTETGFYYLNSRYYDPQVKRFINADGQINTDSLFGTNLFAYCENDPVNRFDPYGQDWAWVGNITGYVYGELTSQTK